MQKGFSDSAEGMPQTVGHESDRILQMCLRACGAYNKQSHSFASHEPRLARLPVNAHQASRHVCRRCTWPLQVQVLRHSHAGTPAHHTHTRDAPTVSHQPSIQQQGCCITCISKGTPQSSMRGPQRDIMRTCHLECHLRRQGRRTTPCPCVAAPSGPSAQSMCLHPAWHTHACFTVTCH